MPQSTTVSSQTKGHFLSGSQHPDWQHSLPAEMVGRQYGLVKIISRQIQRRKKRIYWFVECTTCGAQKWINADNLKANKSKGCQSCSQTKSKHSAVLGRRYDAILARCTNPSHKHYPSYGGRGIQLQFKSRMEFILWVGEHLPHQDYKGVEIDRVDNNGHYAPGNLRLATRREQVNNRRNTAKVSWQGREIPLSEFPSPYTPSWTYKLVVKNGLTGEQVLERFASTTS